MWYSMRLSPRFRSDQAQNSQDGWKIFHYDVDQDTQAGKLGMIVERLRKLTIFTVLSGIAIYGNRSVRLLDCVLISKPLQYQLRS